MELKYWKTAAPVQIDVVANDIGSTIFLESVSTSMLNVNPIISGNSISYTPPPGTGPFVDEFTYTISDTDPSNMRQPRRLSYSRTSTATVVVSVVAAVIPPGPPPTPQPGSITALDDSFQINAQQGQVEIPILNNDSGNSIFIESISGNLQGFASITADRQRLLYAPPPNLIGTITELLTYTIRSQVDNLQTSARVGITVVGRAPGVSTNAPPPRPVSVPTVSIGKIRSELPVARAVENLCDLLSFRSDPGSNHNVSAAQMDLRNCACAIVNEADPKKQRNAITQLSGGQHQFSDTVLRFAKANVSVIARRTSELRKIIRTTSGAQSSNLTRSERELIALRQQTHSHNKHQASDLMPEVSSLNGSHLNQFYTDYPGNPEHIISEDKYFDTLAISSSNSYISFSVGRSSR